MKKRKQVMEVKGKISEFDDELEKTKYTPIFGMVRSEIPIQVAPHHT